MTETRIPLSRPDLSGAEVEEVLGVLRSPFLSMGPKVVEFEQHFAAFLGVQHAVAVATRPAPATTCAGRTAACTAGRDGGGRRSGGRHLRAPRGDGRAAGGRPRDRP